MQLTSHDYQTVHIVCGACMCLCAFIFNADHGGLYVYRAVRYLAGVRARGTAGGGEQQERGVRRGEKSAGTLLNCRGRRCERTYNSLGQWRPTNREGGGGGG